MSRSLIALAAVALLAGCGGLKKAKLLDLTVTTSSDSLKVGTSLQLDTKLTYEGRRSPSPKPQPAWSSSDMSIADVTSGGVVNGRKPGSVTITAQLADKRHSIALRVTQDAVLVNVQVEVPSAQLPVGATALLIARGVYNDTTTADVTDQAEWASSDATVAKVANSGVKGLLSTLKSGATDISARIGAIEGRVTVRVGTIRSIAVEPISAVVARGTTRKFTATATYTDNVVGDISTMATWTSSAPGVATISNTDATRGVATGVSAGQTNITAAVGTITSPPSRLIVTTAAVRSLSIAPANPSLGIGAVQQFTATAVFVDNNTADVTEVASWSSSAPGVASIDAAGKLTTVALGMTNVSARYGEFSAQSTVTVTNARVDRIEVSPISANATANLPRGLTQAYKAVAIFTDRTQRDVTSDAVWTTVDTRIATVSNAIGSRGLVTAVSRGETMVTAGLEGKVGSARVTVTDAVLTALALSPSNQRIPVDGRVAYTARGLFSDGSNRIVTNEVTWTSSAPGVAMVSNTDGARGVATALSIGATTIRAQINNVSLTTTLTVSNAVLSSITVTPVQKTIARTTSVQMVAIGIYDDNSHEDITDLVTWSSSAVAAATVSNAAGSRGLVTGVTAGPATITATMAGKTGTAVVTVTGATLSSLTISPTNRSIARDSVVAFAASGVFSDNTTQDLTDQVTWASSATAIATISNASPTRGRATAVSAGTSTISATFAGVTTMTNLTVTAATLTTITVSPAMMRLAPGTMRPLVASGTFSDGTSQDLTAVVFWQSSKPEIATVSIALDHEGEVSGVAPGTAVVSAILGTATGDASVEVSSATLSSLSVTPEVAAIAVGTVQPFVATGNFSDGSTQDLTTQVTWTSSDETIAVISNVLRSEGRATGLRAGIVTIRAAFGTVIDTSILSVSNTPLVSIGVTPATPSIALGTRQSFVATGVYMDGTTQPLTELVTWASSDATVAPISNLPANRGEASGIKKGTATITATLGTMVGTTTLTVSDATLTSIDLEPVGRSIALGTKVQFLVTGTYSDSTTQNVTATATWESSTPAVATISNTGEATGVTKGSTIVKATVAGKTDTVTLTVTDATLSMITLSQLNPSVAKGLTINFQAQGQYSDGSTQDVTLSATWSSTVETVATVSNDPATKGRATAVNVGTTSVRAQVGGVIGSTNVIVTNATLDRIEVNPPTPSIAKGTQQQFTATGVYSDNSTQPLTDSATWTAETTGQMTPNATVSTADGSRGLATAVTLGQATIRATAGGKTGSAVITVTDAVLKGVSVTASSNPAPLGVIVSYTATGLYTDNTTQNLTSSVTWSSSNETVGTISNADPNRGKVTTLTQGTTTITAVSPPSMGVFTGTDTLTVSAATVASIQITGRAKIANLTMMQFQAVATYTDGQTQNITSSAVWSSTDETIATVTGGIVTGVTPGNISIRAAFGGQTGTHLLQISNATITSMAVDPGTLTIADGSTASFTPTGSFSDGTTQDLILQAIWASENPSIASISNDPGSRGVLTALSGGGPIRITATWNGVSNFANVTVSAAELREIQVTPAQRTILVGNSLRYTAVGVYSDGSTADISGSVTWTPSNAAATISNAAASKGVATGVAVGTPSIVATLGPVAGSTQLFIIDAPITSIMISPDPVSKPIGVVQGFTAIATLSGGGTQDITDQVLWASSNPNNVRISNAAGTRGQATGIVIGTTANIFASYEGVASNLVVFTVNAATLATIAVTPDNSSVAKGTAVPFTAIGTYSDGSAQDLTTHADLTWESSALGVATISNVAPKGQASTPGTGTSTITARFVGTTVITGTTQLTVTPATLMSISVTPAGGSVAVNATVQFVATGLFSDNSMQVLTNQVTWGSSKPGVATISNAVGSLGRATGVSSVDSPTTITAQHVPTGRTGTTTLAVTP